MSKCDLSRFASRNNCEIWTNIRKAISARRLSVGEMVNAIRKTSSAMMKGGIKDMMKRKPK